MQSGINMGLKVSTQLGFIRLPCKASHPVGDSWGQLGTAASALARAVPRQSAPQPKVGFSSHRVETREVSLPMSILIILSLKAILASKGKGQNKTFQLFQAWASQCQGN